MQTTVEGIIKAVHYAEVVNSRPSMWYAKEVGKVYPVVDSRDEADWEVIDDASNRTGKILLCEDVKLVATPRKPTPEDADLAMLDTLQTIALELLAEVTKNKIQASGFYNAEDAATLVDAAKEGHDELDAKLRGGFGRIKDLVKELREKQGA